MSITYVMMAFRTGEQMNLCRYHDRHASERAVQQGTSQREERPAGMRDGAKAALVAGDRDLEAVGESFYQPASWNRALPAPLRRSHPQ